MWPPPAARREGGRLHLHQGPIDLVIRAWGEPAEVEAAYTQAETAFQPVLTTLIEELEELRLPVGDAPPALSGPVARRMVDAAWPHRTTFITPMAAVAGAVADHMLAALHHGRRLDRAFVNDGGDIAIHLSPGASITIGMVADIAFPSVDGIIRLRAEHAVRGVATSGRAGRSYSLGIADAVTVLARDAAAADAAATLIANAVDLDHPAVSRCPAHDIEPNSDLEHRLVTLDVGPLTDTEIETALAAGVAHAEAMRAAGHIEAVALWLRGRCRLVGGLDMLLPGRSDAARDE